MNHGTFCTALLLLACSAPALRAQPCQMGAGTEGRRWLPESAHVDNPLTRLPVQVQDGVTIAARDGTRLDARLFLPALAAGAPPTPCRLMSDGYGRSSNTGAGTFTWTVLQDAGHPAVLTLPVVGMAREQLPRLTVTQQ